MQIFLRIVIFYSSILFPHFIYNFSSLILFTHFDHLLQSLIPYPSCQAQLLWGYAQTIIILHQGSTITLEYISIHHNSSPNRNNLTPNTQHLKLNDTSQHFQSLPLYQHSDGKIADNVNQITDIHAILTKRASLYT